MMDGVNPVEAAAVDSPYPALLRAGLLIPFSHYVLGLLIILTVFLYNFLEMHFLEDLFTGFRGQTILLTFNPASQLYHEVVSKCKIFRSRYLSTPWLCSPHLQTLFIHYFGNPPFVNYRRQIFMTSDGGTLALDWVTDERVKQPSFPVNDALLIVDKNPILLIIPGLTSDSNSNYVKHLAYNMAKRGWNVVVGNHRGLGGVSITSDIFYNAGWTEDVRKVIDHLHCQYPEAPLFVVGTSIGANILVKYLAEDRVSTPIIGAAAICSPWDLLICDRFMNRNLAQRLYNKALTIGLKDYAQLHGDVLSRLLNWEGLKKSSSVRDFDDCATRVLGNYETVDTYYRRCSSSNFIRSVTVPLLCISSLDDPVCTSEGIPWDECRLNSNVILATTQHGGHLPFFEGLTARSVWWVRAVDEFFGALQSCHPSTWLKQTSVSSVNPQSSIDHAPYVHILEDGMVTAVSDEPMETEALPQEEMDLKKTGDTTTHSEPIVQQKQETTPNLTQPTGVAQPPDISNLAAPIVKCLRQLTSQNKASLWLLAYIAFMTTWPVLGSALSAFYRKRFRGLLSKTLKQTVK